MISSQPSVLYCATTLRRKSFHRENLAGRLCVVRWSYWFCVREKGRSFVLRCGKLGREVEQVPCGADPVQEREGGILDFFPGEAKRIAVVGHRKALAERCFRRRGGGGIGSWASRNAP